MTLLDHLITSKKSVLNLPQYTRDDLAKTLRLLEFRSGVEVGSAMGHYTEYLCQQNPQMNITAVDPWEPYKGYTDYKKHRTLNGLYNTFKRRMAGYGNHTVMRKFSMDALQYFQDESLDFVYIDANHDEPWVSQDIHHWYKKVRKGGILAGHDYVELSRPDKPNKNWQVKPAVDRFVELMKIKKLIILGKGDSESPKAGDLAPSWVFFKP